MAEGTRLVEPGFARWAVAKPMGVHGGLVLGTRTVPEQTPSSPPPVSFGQIGLEQANTLAVVANQFPPSPLVGLVFVNVGFARPRRIQQMKMAATMSSSFF